MKKVNRDKADLSLYLCQVLQKSGSQMKEVAHCHSAHIYSHPSPSLLCSFAAIPSDEAMRPHCHSTASIKKCSQDNYCHCYNHRTWSPISADHTNWTHMWFDVTRKYFVVKYAKRWAACHQNVLVPTNTNQNKPHSIHLLSVVGDKLIRKGNNNIHKVVAANKCRCQPKNQFNNIATKKQI